LIGAVLAWAASLHIYPSANLGTQQVEVHRGICNADAEVHAMQLDIVIAKQAVVVTTAELADALPTFRHRPQ